MNKLTLRQRVTHELTVAETCKNDFQDRADESNGDTYYLGLVKEYQGKVEAYKKVLMFLDLKEN